MRIVRFDSIGGASGDMILGALASIGCDLNRIATDLHAILPEIIGFSCNSAAGYGLQGQRVQVQVHAGHTVSDQDPAWPDALPAFCPPHPHGPHADHTLNTENNAHSSRMLPEIEAVLEAPSLTARTRQMACAVFRRLAAAEAEIHGKTPETVHFHEVGAVDAIADVVGACLALEQLDVAAVILGPLPCGTGTLVCAHGVMPNPAPATMRLLVGLATVQTDEPFELVTPTGAAILATWAEFLENNPVSARVIRTGFGFGQRVLHGRPNVLRATLLESLEPPAVTDDAVAAAEPLWILETNLDDCNPQWIGDIIGRLMEAGARDAWATPVIMKKGRPGFVLSVLTAANAAAALKNLIFLASTTFGIRSYTVTRTILDRRFETVRTPWGDVRMKIGALANQDIVRTPEFEDCARLARAAGVMPRQVYEAAQRGCPSENQEKLN